MAKGSEVGRYEIRRKKKRRVRVSEEEGSKKAKTGVTKIT